MPEYVYVMKSLTKLTPSGDEILSDIGLSFFPGAKIGVIGPNGSGKSTLLRIMAGLDTPSEGEAWPGKGVTVGHLPQEPQLDASRTVRENVLEGIGESARLVERFEELSSRLAEPLDDDEMQKVYDEMAEVQDAIDAADAWDLDRTIEVAMDALRVPDGDDVSVLSGGERRRVALCRLLLSRPDLLLLDEPTNHLDAETVAWLQRHLQEYDGTVVAVTHDRYFLDEVAGWILELDHGRGVPYKGNYSGWLEQKTRRLDQQDRGDSPLHTQLAAELEWVRESQQGRRSRARERLGRYDALVARDLPKRVTKPIITLPDGPRLGDVVVEADGLTHGYGDRLLFDDLTFDVPPGGVVGVIGANGAGKTSLFRLIVGEEEPTAGRIRVGDSVEISYVDQSRAALDDAATVFEDITGGGDWVRLGEREMASRAYVAAFGFKGADQQKPVGACSGGERNRIHLAKLLQRPANLLLLDEPTNDLDVDTLRGLEEAILEFAGSVMVVSHDRWFLDRVATHILAFEGDSEVVHYPGGYSEYAEDARRRRGTDVLQPTRIRYRPLTRS